MKDGSRISKMLGKLHYGTLDDNLELLDLQKLTQSKRSKRLIEKMSEYKQFLDSLTDYKTTYLDIGDGFAITRRIKEKE